jgi:hypothetical protein
MGIIFLVIWLVIFAAIAAILGVIGVAVVYPFLSKKARKRKMLLTFLTPIVGIASYVGSSVIAMIIISELLNVDIGFGDSWKTPLPNGYQLISVDVPDNGSIYKDDDHHAESIDGVQQIKVIGDSVIGLSGNKYFLLDTKIHKVTYYPSALKLQNRVGKTNISLTSNDDYYWAVREKAYIIGGIICLLFTLFVLFVLWKVGLSFHFQVQSKFSVANTTG